MTSGQPCTPGPEGRTSSGRQTQQKGLGKEYGSLSTQEIKMVCQLGPRHCPGPRNEKANKALDLRPEPSCVPVLPPPGSGQPPLWSHPSLHSGSAGLLATWLPPLSARPGQSAVQRFSHPTRHPRSVLPHWVVATGLHVHLSLWIQLRPSSQLAVTSAERHSQIASQPQTLLSLPLARCGASPKPARPRPGSCPQTSLRSSKRPICLPACL